MNVPEGLFFTKEHEWVKIDGSRAKVGITDFAQHKLGDITYVELPAIGKLVKQNEILTSIESVKAASDIYSPVTGKVISVNSELNTAPEIVNQDPYGKGWIAELDSVNPEDAKKLMDDTAYSDYVKGLE